MKKTTVNLTPYEKKQYQEIVKWMHQSPSMISKISNVTDKILAPLNWAFEKLIPVSVIRGALSLCSVAAEVSAVTRDIRKKAGVEDVKELRGRDLALSDKFAGDVKKWAIALATGEGGVAGYCGVAGLVIDIPALITLSLNTVYRIGACYGYASDGEEDRNFAMSILAAASACDSKEKKYAISILEQTSDVMSKKAIQQITSNSGRVEKAISALRALAKMFPKSVSKYFAKISVKKSMPIISAVIGAAVNANYINDVATAARRMYQQRWLMDNGKLILEDAS